MILASPGTSGRACGKAILIGEHSAVDGHPALALPLHSQSLEIFFGEKLNSGKGYQGWLNAWVLMMGETCVQLPTPERERLSASLQLAVQLICGNEFSLEQFEPQTIQIHSQLPLGAGMGGSAALSAALLRAVAAARGVEKNSSEIASLANHLDGVFHGRASGLDAATVVAEGVIRFQKGYGAVPVRNQTPFWLLLVDTHERTPTRLMVEQVAQLRKADPPRVEASFIKLASLASLGEQALACGQLLELGKCLNQAHKALQNLGVSTKRLDACVEDLRTAGAFGAKLTGGGGGGLALALFASQPPVPFSAAWSDALHFLTFVPASESA
ncbi:mevalonate kinase [bacterium]|nr:mevalonate kinase [bacterium]